MVVEVDLSTNQIKKVETQAHDSPDDIKLMLQALINQNAVAAAERAATVAAATPAAIPPMDIHPTSKSGRFLSEAIADYVDHLKRKKVLGLNTIDFTHAPSLRLFRELISDKRNLFGDPEKRNAWDIRLQLITPEKMDRFLAPFCKIAELIGLWSDSQRTSREVKEVARLQLADLEERRREIEQMMDELSVLVNACHGDDQPHCAILERFSGGSPAQHQPQHKPQLKKSLGRADESGARTSSSIDLMAWMRGVLVHHGAH